jgi:hypothetical protein
MSAAAITMGIELALQLLTRSQQISSLVAQAQSSGRTTFTPEEWQAITGLADESREALVAAINARG